MKKFVLALLSCLLLVASITPVYAPINIEALVNDSVEDRLINSPILILGTIILINIIAIIYRKVRK